MTALLSLIPVNVLLSLYAWVLGPVESGTRLSICLAVFLLVLLVG